MIAGLPFFGVSGFGAHINPLVLHLWADPKAGWGCCNVRSFKGYTWDHNTWGRVGICGNFPGTESEEPFLGLVYSKNYLDTIFFARKMFLEFFYHWLYWDKTSCECSYFGVKVLCTIQLFFPKRAAVLSLF